MSSDEKKKDKRWAVFMVFAGVAFILRGLSYPNLSDFRAASARNDPVSGWVFVGTGAVLVLCFSYILFKARDR
jgi:hypothetical protein